jgi:hypothetical protein
MDGLVLPLGQHLLKQHLPLAVFGLHLLLSRLYILHAQMPPLLWMAVAVILDGGI